MANPKSAYSIPTKKGKLDTHIIVIWVDTVSYTHLRAHETGA